MAIRVLMVYGEPFVYGGQETFSINVYKYINKNKIKLDFYTPYKIENKSLISILNKNSKFYHDDMSFSKKDRKKNFIIGFKNFINNRKDDYDVVHINSGSSFVLAIGATLAKSVGIKQVIVHSHASGTTTIKHKIINKILEKGFKNADVFLSCSKEAAELRFPDYVIKQKLYKIITNGIDLMAYEFDANIRKKYRKKMNVKDDEILLGNVGRLSKEKNQVFIIDLLNKLRYESEKYKLLLIGDGEEEKNIIYKIKEYSLEKKVIMLKKRNDINNLLMAMDIFVFPSYYEGLGIALIEAEAVGLPAICSKGIPEQSIINNNCYQIDNYNIDEWKSKILSVDIRKKVNTSEIQLYSIWNTINQLTEIYESRIVEK